MTELADRVSKEVHIVVSCSSRKRTPPPPRLQLRHVRPRSSGAVAKWIEQLGAATEEEHPAEVLYAGEHWSVVKRLASREGSLKIRVWVASAGYGLVPYRAPLKPYSATFDRAHLDMVPIAPELWWRRLAEWPGPATDSPRTLTSLAEANAGAALLLVLSGRYLEACRSDALGAAAVLRRRGQFAVVSCGERGRWIAEHVLPADARIQGFVGGSRQALNARVAEHILATTLDGFSVRATRDYLGALMHEQPGLPVYDRRRLSDEEIRRFIRRSVHQRDVARTPLLSELRQSGHACEQGRFRQLYEEMCS
jgi:hypothetical protein